MTKKNSRSLDAIADDIHKLDRTNTFDKGDLLIEAKAQCEHGQWLAWLDRDLDYSVDTAERYMSVAELATKFRNLRNLKLAKSTLYKLSDQEDDDLPAIITELAKHATKKKLRPRDAERVISIGIGRHLFGDYPDATLAQLTSVNSQRHHGFGWIEDAIAALQEQKPETDKAALSIVNEILLEHQEDRRKTDEAARLQHWQDCNKAQQEAMDILDGPPPELPPSTALSEHQKLGADTEWAEFVEAVKQLQGLHTMAAARFVGMFTPAELHQVANFLLAIAAADEAASASPTPAM
jgi:hypothetical protein